MKSAVEEGPHKRPEKNKKNKPLELLKSPESQRENKPEKRTKYMKTALQIAKNETPQHRKAKEQACAEKANKWMDPATP